MPGRATGASTAWNRVPSASRTSTYGRGVVEPAPAGGREPLGQPADRLVVGEPHGRSARDRAPRSTVDLVRTVDQHVGHAGRPAAAARADPAPTTSRRSASWTASTVASPTGRPAARSASATRCGVSAPGRSGQPVPDLVDETRPARRLTATAPESLSRAASTVVGGPARGVRGADRTRAQPEVDRTRRAGAGPTSRRPREHRSPRRSRPRAPRDRAPPGAGRARGWRVQSRTVDATPSTVAVVTTTSWSSGYELVGEDVPRARQVDDDGVVAPLGCRQRLAQRRSPAALASVSGEARSARPARPGPGRRHAARRAPSRPVVCCRSSHRTPVAGLHAEHPVQPGAVRVGVDHQGGSGSGGDLAERTGEGRGPGPATPTDHPQGQPARTGRVGEVGQRPPPASARHEEARRRPARRARARGGTRRPGDPAQATRTHLGPTRRGTPDQLGGEVQAHEHHRRRQPRPQPRARLRARPPGSRRRRQRAGAARRGAARPGR